MDDSLLNEQRQQLTEEVKRLEAGRIRLEQSNFILLLENFKSGKKLVVEVITISSVIIGFFSVTPSQNNIIKEECFLTGAFFFFIVTIFLGILFNLLFIYEDKKSLNEKYPKMDKMLVERVKMARESISINTQESYIVYDRFCKSRVNELKKEQKPFSFLSFKIDPLIIICMTFSAGMMLLILSCIDF